MNNKRILIITHHLLPYTHSLGGVSRIVNFINFLSSKNYEIDVIASRGKNYSYFGYRKIFRSISTHYIIDLLKFIFDRRLSKMTIQNKSVNDNFFYKIFQVFLSSIKKFSKNFIFPDVAIFVVPQFLFKSIYLIQKKKIKNIYISCPPHSLSLVGFFLKLIFKNKINFILDYRDSWTMTNINQSKYNLVRKINFYLEKVVLKSCDYLIYTTEPMLLKLIRKIDFDIKLKSLLVMNGHSTLPTQKIKKNLNNKINIGYFGVCDSNLNGYRNINLFVDILIKYKLYVFFNLHLYGSCNTNLYSSKNDFIFFHGNLNHSLALNKMTEMDYLLLIHTNTTNSDEVITGKFFDYVAANRPILSFSPKNMEANKLISKFNLGYFLSLDGDYCYKVLRKLKKNEKLKLSRSQIYKFSRVSQFKKILPILK